MKRPGILWQRDGAQSPSLVGFNILPMVKDDRRLKPIGQLQFLLAPGASDVQLRGLVHRLALHLTGQGCFAMTLLDQGVLPRAVLEDLGFVPSGTTITFAARGPQAQPRGASRTFARPSSSTSPKGRPAASERPPPRSKPTGTFRRSRLCTYARSPRRPALRRAHAAQGAGLDRSPWSRSGSRSPPTPRRSASPRAFCRTPSAGARRRSWCFSRRATATTSDDHGRRARQLPRLEGGEHASGRRRGATRPDRQSDRRRRARAHPDVVNVTAGSSSSWGRRPLSGVASAPTTPRLAGARATVIDPPFFSTASVATRTRSAPRSPSTASRTPSSASCRPTSTSFPPTSRCSDWSISRRGATTARDRRFCLLGRLAPGQQRGRPGRELAVIAERLATSIPRPTAAAACTSRP